MLCSLQTVQDPGLPSDSFPVVAVFSGRRQVRARAQADAAWSPAVNLRPSSQPGPSSQEKHGSHTEPPGFDINGGSCMTPI